MKYCRRCILPDTRPGIVLDAEGICSACRGHEDKENRIDWQARRGEFLKIVEQAKKTADAYHCIVPVSGGKDSWYQIIKAQEFGLKVLGVTWRTPARTKVGQDNLETMVRVLGIDHLDYTIAPDVERRMIKAAYEKKGATAIPMHLAIFAIPTRLAVAMRIPLVLWGENPQLEFGGPEADRLSTDLDLEWVRKYGVSNQTSWKDWVGEEGLTEEELIAYRLPAEAEFAAFAPRSIFVGSFFKWNSFENAEVARQHGFLAGMEHRKTGAWDFADIDCDFIALHHFLKWYKFGITRDFDNLSVEIRYGRITRDDALAQLQKAGLQIPLADIRKFCEFVGQPERWFWDIAEKFRNTDIWYQDGDIWKIRDFLISDWYWQSAMEIP